MKILIRKTRASDLVHLLRLGKQQWKIGNEWLTKDYLRSALNQPGISRTAWHGKKIVGGMIFVHEDIVPNWLRYIIVDPEMRGRGIGRMLMQKVFDKLPKETIFVDTGVTDKSALAFYKKIGFQKCGFIKGLYGKEDAHVLKKYVD